MALSTIKEATVKIDDDYRISNLLSQLKTNSPQTNNSTNQFFLKKLHPRLLKTSQKSQFINSYLLKTEKDITVNKTNKDLEAHLNHFKCPNKIQKMNSFLAQKSMKSLRLVEVQFYLNQLTKEEWFNDDQRKEFISRSKQYIDWKANPNNIVSDVFYKYVLECAEAKNCNILYTSESENLFYPYIVVLGYNSLILLSFISSLVYTYSLNYNMMLNSLCDNVDSTMINIIYLNSSLKNYI